MKVISTSKNTLQDKKNPKQFYEYNNEYDVDIETGKRLIASGKFKEVKEPKKENKKDIKEDTNK